MNIGYSKEEIDELKAEMKAEEQGFVFVEDEEGLDDSGEFAHFQFVGTDGGKEVIYDTLMYTLRFHYSSVLFEEAEEIVKESFPDYVAVDERGEDYTENEEAELMIEEIMEQFEDSEEHKVQEFLEVDKDFEYGIGLEVALNIEEITFEIIEKFIEDFNQNKLQLDKTLYSFKDESEDI